MKDHQKTKAELVKEIKELRLRCDDLDKSAQEATLEEERSSEVICQQQAILDNIPDNVWHKDSEGLYVSVSPKRVSFPVLRNLEFKVSHTYSLHFCSTA